LPTVEAALLLIGHVTINPKVLFVYNNRLKTRKQEVQVGRINSKRTPRFGHTFALGPILMSKMINFAIQNENNKYTLLGILPMYQTLSG
ncbi:MAG: hypothetical protein RR356_07920, partial [Bacteroidales bacterium]